MLPTAVSVMHGHTKSCGKCAVSLGWPVHWLDRVLPALQLPNGWLWDMIDEFIYQASTCFLCLLGLVLVSLPSIFSVTHCKLGRCSIMPTPSIVSARLG